MALTTAQARSVVARWQKWADAPGTVAFDQSTVRGLIELGAAQAVLHGAGGFQMQDMPKVLGTLFKQEREITTRQIAESNPATRVARVVLDQHLETLRAYADSFVNKRAVLLSGEPSPLLKSALGVGRGEA